MAALSRCLLLTCLIVGGLTTARPSACGPQRRRLGAPADRTLPPRRRAALAMVDPSSAELAAVAAASVDVPAILSKAGRAALGGGASGAAASAVQVLALMWMRTTINYQYRNGGSAAQALSTLWREGGVGRLYQGLPFALVQAPLTRFGDVAANTGVPILLDAFALSAGLPPFVRQVAPSIVGAAWRTVWMPIDTVKTSLQVEGKSALQTLRGRVEENGPGTLWEGSLAAAATSFAGSYPWWLTYHFLDSALPALDPAADGARLLSLVRLASIGFCAVAVSDTVSNSLRVIKTTKQTSAEPISYVEAVRRVVATDGLQGVFLRGLGSKLIANGLQGAMFSIAWKYFEGVLVGGAGTDRAEKK
ncbi:hypothetical protein KFE25_004551 [Diacronema lutheri]|uniref:Mitochondrial carrier protein n=2 Tax=Diacronema lutheri TaxID=2081491 RepID=A0A8J5XCU6_DIALT|nr:hypothetical protein KFE25_004551 [Diacronema lutheri]